MYLLTFIRPRRDSIAVMDVVASTGVGPTGDALRQSGNSGHLREATTEYGPGLMADSARGVGQWMWSRLLIGGSPLILIVVGALVLYMRTLAPTVATIFDDSLEFQVVGPTLGIAHPTGYPLYTLLAWLFSRLVPWGDAAYRVNLLSAVAAVGTVGFLYLAAEMITGRRLAATLAAIIFALSPVFWSQATLAEVYALHLFFVAFVLWSLLRAERRTDTTSVIRWCVPVAALGLSLTHHRMTILLLPAVAVFILWTEPGLLKPSRSWLGMLVLFAAPLMLYVYLPLRAVVTTSLDGTYSNTLSGFWDWVTASGYNIFLTGNPFDVHYTADFYINLFLEQFGWLGLVLVFFGIFAAFQRPKRWTLLTVALAFNLGFALAYRAADIEVFFLPTFFIMSLFIATGVARLQAIIAQVAAAHRHTIFFALLAMFLLLEPTLNLVDNIPALDRSQTWEVHDYGMDMLRQPEEGGTVIGLLGEMTLMRYFQWTQGMRADVMTVAADSEAGRHEAIDRLLAQGVPVYITRPLAGLPDRYSLTVAGPLVRVWPEGRAMLPPWSHDVGVDFLESRLRWLGYDIVWLHQRIGNVARVRLWWQVVTPLEADYKVSARLLDSTGNQVVQVDDVPVHNTYPTRLWRAGEIVLDGYDLPLPQDAAAPPYRLLIILYDPATGAEAGRHELGLIS